MATKSETLEPSSPITFEVTLLQVDLDRLSNCEESLCTLAAEILGDEPYRAASVQWAANFLAKMRVSAESHRAHPPVRQAAPKKKLPDKQKHVYGPSGFCTIDHNGSGSPCGKPRERKPRTGAAVATAATEDTRTIDIEEHLAAPC